MKKVFIIGNTKAPDSEALFAQAKEELTRQGYKVVNIIEQLKKFNSPDEDFNSELQIAGIIYCNTVFVMQNWSESDLAILELHIAIVCNMEVIKANDTIIPERITIYCK